MHCTFILPKHFFLHIVFRLHCQLVNLRSFSFWASIDHSVDLQFGKMSHFFGTSPVEFRLAHYEKLFSHTLERPNETSTNLKQALTTHWSRTDQPQRITVLSPVNPVLKLKKGTNRLHWIRLVNRKSHPFPFPLVLARKNQMVQTRMFVMLGKIKSFVSGFSRTRIYWWLILLINLIHLYQLTFSFGF